MTSTDLIHKSQLKTLEKHKQNSADAFPFLRP